MNYKDYGKNLGIEFHTKQLIQIALDKCYDLDDAAGMLGIDTSTLYKLRKKYNLKYTPLRSKNKTHERETTQS